MKKLLGKVLRKVIRAAGGLLILVLVLHTPPVRSFLRGILTRFGEKQFNGHIQVGGLNYQLWLGSAELRDVRFDLHGLELRADRVRVAFFSKQGLALEVDRLRAFLLQREDAAAEKGQSQGPSYPWSILGKLATVRIVDGLMEWNRGPVGRTISGSVTLERQNNEKRGREPNWSFRSRLNYLRAGRSPVPFDIEGALGLEGQTLRLTNLHLSSGENSLTASGALRQARPFEGIIRGEVRADMSLTEAFGLELPVRGAIACPFSLEATGSGLRGQVQLSSPGLMLAGTGPWNVDGTARLQKKIIFVEPLLLRGYGGSVTAQGQLDVARGNMNLRLQASGIDMNSLPGAWMRRIPRLAARAGAEAELSLESWQLSRARGEGKLSFEAAQEKGLPLSGKVGVKLENGKLQILTDGLRVAEGSVRLKAALDKKGIDAEYGLKFPASGLQDILSTYGAGPPRLSWTGLFNASGSLKGAYSDLSVTASITGEGLTLQSEKIAVGAELEWGKSGLLVRSAQVSSGSGNLKIQGSIPISRPAGQWELFGAMERFDLSPLVSSWGISALADGTVTIKGSAPGWTARVAVSLKDRETTPRRATVAIEAHGQKDTINLDELRANVGGGSLIASGSYRLDLNEISGRVKGAGVRIGDVVGIPESFGNLSSVLSLDGDLRGKPGGWRGHLGLEFDDLSFKGSRLPKQSLDISFEESEARLTGRGPQPFLNGSCRLQRPYTLQADIDLSPLPHDALLAPFPSLSGFKVISAAGRIQLRLNLEDPSSLGWRGDIEGIKGSYDEQEWTMGSFAIAGDWSSLSLSGFRFQGAHSSLSMDGLIPLWREGAIDLKLDGRLELELLSILYPKLDIRGSSRLGLHLQGTPARPVFRGDLSVSGGSGRFRGIAWENLEAQVQADESQVRLETLSFRVLSGEVKASGNLALSREARAGQVAFEWSRLDAGLLLSSESKLSRPLLRLSGSGRLSIPELKISSLSGRGQITEITTNMGHPPISLEKAVEWTLDNGSFSHSQLRLTGERTGLEVFLKTSPADPRPEFSVRMSGSFNAGAPGQFIPGSGVSFSDTTAISLEGEQKAGALAGRLSLDGGRIQLADPPLSVSQIQARLSLQGQILDVASLKGRVSSGSIEASGRLQFESPGTSPRAELKFTLADVPFLPDQGIFSLVSGQLTLAGGSHQYNLTGDIIVHRVFFRREMDAASESLSLIDRQLNILEGRSSLADRIALNIKFQVRDFRMENRLAQLSAEGILSAEGTLSKPEIGGSISVNAGGSLNLGRAQIVVSDGRVILDNYPEEPLELEIGGITRISGVYMELRVKGPTDNLQTQIQAPYRSDLTQGDLLMLLMTGRKTQEAVSQAGTVAAESLAGALGSALQRSAGERVYIDVSSDQSFFSYDSDPTTWFSLGKEVLPNVYVIYAMDLAGAQRRGVFAYMPKELPLRLRLIFEDDGRTMLEVNHRLEAGFRAGQGRGGERPGRERIGRLSFRGLSPLDDRALRKLVKLKPGKKYDALTAQTDADRLRKELEKRGYRSARVELETTLSSPGRRDVTFLIESGKRIRLAWKGDAIGKRTRKAIESLWNATASEDLLAETLARKTEYALRAERYYLARVAAERTDTKEEVTVSLLVSKGPRGDRLVLRFRGNKALSDKALAASLPAPGKRDFFEAIEGNASTLRNTLRMRYAAEGYLQAGIQPVETKYHKETGEYLVTVPIDEGTRSLVADVTLPAEVKSPAEPKGPELEMKPGEPFRIEQYLHDRLALSRYYREQGYAQARVAGVFKPAEDRVSVAFTVSDTSRPRVGNIRLARPGRTREAVVRNLLTLKEGDLIPPSEIDLSRKRLFDTRVFKSVDIRAVESSGNPGSRDLVVDLIEKKDLELNYGLRYEVEDPTYGENSGSDTYSPLEVGGQVQLQNIFGYANRFGLSGYLFGEQQSGRVFFESETFFKLPVPTQIYASTEQNSELEISGLEEYIRKITFQQYYRLGETVRGTRWSERLRFQWNYSFRHIRLVPLEADLAPVNTDRGSISLSLIGDTRDSFINPTRGTFWSVASEFSRTWLGSDVNYVRLYGQGFLYVPLARNVVWVSGLRLGAVPGENPLLTLEDRFKAGGPSTVRAFALNSLGPKNAKGEPLGGQALAVFNQELRFPLYKSLNGGIFYDTGNVFLLADMMSISDLRHCVGAGLRYLFPFGPLRVDWAYALDPDPGEKRYRFILTLGHAF